MPTIGRICAQYRREGGYRLSDIARDTKTTPANICHFEHDRNDSRDIFLWYILHGLTAEYIQNNMEVRNNE